MSPIEAHVGPMFSGKSGTLIKEANDAINHGNQEFGRDFLAFNSPLDKRYGENVISDHRESQIPAIAIEKSIDILHLVLEAIPVNLEDITYDYIKPELVQLKTIYIDEAQFFDADLPFVLEILDSIYAKHPARQKPLVIKFAGLDLDFRGESFPGVMAILIGISNEVVKHKGYCSVCGEHNATRTQRLVNGEPANYNDPIILVGAKESYTTRCADDHQVPGKPTPIL